MSLSLLPTITKHSIILIIIALAVTLAFVLEQLLGNSFSQLWVYQRSSIAQGELWRLISGHLLHTNSYHLLFNLAALLLLWLLHGKFYTRVNFSLLFLFSALVTSAGIYYFNPELMQYVGLSGVLHGFFVFGAIMDIRAQDKTGYLLFIGLWIKVAHEQLYGASSAVSDLIEASVAIDAHLWGAISGLVFSFIYLITLKYLITNTKET